MARKKKYLNNSDLLKQIHISKLSYSKFLDPARDNQQDIILYNVEEIYETQNIQIGKDELGEPIMGDVPVIKIAKQLRAKRLNKLNENKLNENEIKLTEDDINVEDIVFRILTTEHIPQVPKKKARKKQVKKKRVISTLFEEFHVNEVEEPEQVPLEPVEMVPMRCKFPPFYHYRIDKDLKPFVVGKSHWTGELDSGEFCMTHGNITTELANMYMKLCERYATRGNWRGYTYNDEMKGTALVQLTYVGLQFNEAKSQNPFAYLTAIMSHSFTQVLNNEKKSQNIRDDILEANGLNPSWTRQLANDNSHQRYLDNPDD